MGRNASVADFHCVHHSVRKAMIARGICTLNSRWGFRTVAQGETIGDKRTAVPIQKRSVLWIRDITPRNTIYEATINPWVRFYFEAIRVRYRVWQEISRAVPKGRKGNYRALVEVLLTESLEPGLQVRAPERLPAVYPTNVGQPHSDPADGANHATGYPISGLRPPGRPAPADIGVEGFPKPGG